MARTLPGASNSRFFFGIFYRFVLDTFVFLDKFGFDSIDISKQFCSEETIDCLHEIRYSEILGAIRAGMKIRLRESLVNLIFTFSFSRKNNPFEKCFCTYDLEENNTIYDMHSYCPTDNYTRVTVIEFRN